MRLFSSSVAGYVVLVLLLASVAVGQDEEGSGDGYEDDEDGESPSVPSRPTTPQLVDPSPTMDIVPTKTRAAVTEGATTRVVGDADSIYLEEGSGYPTPDPSGGGVRNTPRIPSASATPEMPTLVTIPGYSGGGAIVTHRIENQPPQLQKKLKKIPVTAGRYVSWKIPEDTFFDEEDGSTRNLRLTLRYENGTVISDSADWVRFDVKKQVVHLLPVDENDIGRWRFLVYAVDSNGQSAKDTLEIVVRQFSGSRLINHQLEVEFSFVNWKPNLVRNWEWMVMEKLRQVFQDPNYDHMIVRKLSKNPFSFGWTNSSLIEHACPRKEIAALYQMLTEQGSLKRRLPGGRRLKKLMGKDVHIRSVDLKFFGACLEQIIPDGGHGQSANKKESSPAAPPPPSPRDNSVPIIRNDIDLINVTAGELLRYKVPEDTCFDHEDGPTNRLSLQLLTMNRKELSARSWLQFDSRNQEFVGVPSLLEVGREEYQLVCSDRNGLSVIDGLVVDVRNRPFSERFGAEFVLEFSDNVESRKIGVVEQLASFFGDSTPHNVVLKSVNEHTVVWLNKSLGNMGCDTPEISWMRSKLTSTEDDDDYVPKEDDYRMGRDGSQASPALKRHFQNFGLTDAYVVLRGSCILKPPSNDADVGEDVGSRDGDSGSIFHGLISGDSLLTFLVPAAIIILMLSLAILLACVLHMKRKAGKLNLFYSESLPPRVPVILQDELIDVDQNAYQKRTVVAASATSNQRLPEFERLIMPKSHNGQMEMSPRPTPAYQFRHT